MSKEDPSQSSRELTNQRLRAERGDIDKMIQELADVDTIADAAITRARLRADEVLAVARAKIDSALDSAGPLPLQTRILRQQRSVEDSALRNERHEADAVLQFTRGEKTTRLEAERHDTDEGLSGERAESDHVLATRDEVLRIVSHDLNNMLGTVLGMAAIIVEDSDPAGASGTFEHAQWITRAAMRMKRLVGDLTDAASIEAGALALAMEAADPAAVVSEAVGTFQVSAAERNIELVAEIAATVPLARMDPARIYQVVTNLLSNAIKFTPRAGRVVAHVVRQGEEILFSVRDTGSGIAADMLTPIFTRHVQLEKNDRRGVGLGLYISRSIVRAHGGRIWAESVPGEGSTFFFTVPIAPAG